MSFFGSNSRPDLLKGSKDNEPERTPPPSETRFVGEMPAADNSPPPPFSSDTRSAYAVPSPSAPAAGDRPTPIDQCTNVIASGARWKGSLKVEDSVRVDGTFSGDIEAKGTVHVSQGAEVDAKVHAAFVVVSGSFRGEIRADQKAEMLPNSRVTGEVITKVLSVHEGATIDGNIQMNGDGPRNNSAGRRNGATSDAEPSSGERRGRSETPAT